MVDSDLEDINEVYLEEIDKSDLIENLLEALEHMSTLLKREDKTLEIKEIKGEIFELTHKVTRVLGFLTTLIESEEHKFKKKEILTLTQLKQSSYKLTALIKSEENIFETTEKALKIIALIMKSEKINDLIPALMDYEERRFTEKEIRRKEKEREFRLNLMKLLRHHYKTLEEEEFRKSQEAAKKTKKNPK